MKKIISGGIALLTVLMLSSCNDLAYIDTDQKDSSDAQEFSYSDSDDLPLKYNGINGVNVLQYSDGYLFFHNNYNRSMLENPKNRTVMKYNVKTDNLTFVCQDPLCFHNTMDCPFYSMDRAMYVFDGSIAYTQLYSITDSAADSTMAGKAMLYNIKNNSSVVRKTFETNSYAEYMSMLFADPYILYYENTYNEELEDWVDGIYKWNTEDHSIALLCGENNIYTQDSKYPGLLACQLLFAMDSRIFFTDGAVIYSTDINYENRIDHVKGQFVLDVFTDGEYIYYGVPVSDGSYIQSLHRVDFDGKNDMDLNITATKQNISITKNYIYYKKHDEIDIGACRVSGYAGSRVVLENSEIWRCDHNGQNHELVYKFEGDMAAYRMLYETYVGNYIYGLYSWWEDADGDGIYEEGDNHFSAGKDEYKIMRIDITTGEIYIIDGIR